jgi:signal transduction histidine kinase
MLRRDVLAGQIIPAKVDEYFGPAAARDYRVWILDESDGAGAGKDASIVYASDAGRLESDMASPDIERRVQEGGVAWRVAAKHELGSLDASVRQFRWRNLSLGFGTVLVLGTSVLFLGVAARRSQRLAERQIEFVAGVSHELRTPIAGISSLSQNLADGVVDDPDRVAQYGESINAESHRLHDMVEKVLQFSAIRSGQYRYEHERVDLAWIVEKELGSLSNSIRPAFDVTLDLAADIPPVRGDVQALRSVVRNLVSNALKFQGQSGPIRVSARVVHQGGRPEVELVVADSGRGIGSSDLPHIFEPFYRGQDSRSGHVPGSGLGLSLVREIVDEHRGRVRVESGVGEGTRFFVYLPAAARDVAGCDDARG